MPADKITRVGNIMLDSVKMVRPAIDAADVACELSLPERYGGRAGVRLIGPQPSIRFMSLVTGAAVAITDSGGVQEETTYLGIPCLTLRDNTERPIL